MQVAAASALISGLQGVPKIGLTRGNSGAKGTRTPNPLLAKQVRYQLRHGPSAVIPLMGGPATEDENPHQASAPHVCTVCAVKLAAPSTAF